MPQPIGIVYAMQRVGICTATDASLVGTPAHVLDNGLFGLVASPSNPLAFYHFVLLVD